jgi:hypothetical protein
MNEGGQAPDLFNASETSERLHQRLMVICFIFALGVVVMYELH